MSGNNTLELRWEAGGRPETIKEWGEVMRLARRASNKAIEEQRAAGKIRDSLEAHVALYTDDPSTAWLLMAHKDTAAICGVSGIEAVSIVMGENFPPQSHEAERDDLELPRVAAMFFRATGKKCPRCRSYKAKEEGDLCERCYGILGEG